MQLDDQPRVTITRATPVRATARTTGIITHHPDLIDDVGVPFRPACVRVDYTRNGDQPWEWTAAIWGDADSALVAGGRITRWLHVTSAQTFGDELARIVEFAVAEHPGCRRDHVTPEQLAEVPAPRPHLEPTRIVVDGKSRPHP